ncbi:MAG: fused MFS/spermidine synthase [Phycisphaerales bacterium]|nr:fused MFS/spermidine synthase [Phycisphaerales bacterium]
MKTISEPMRGSAVVAAIWPFALAIFLGAFLLFQVEPIMGRYILPWFGGAPGVWTACMLFFQMLLLGGYAYAHFSIQKLSPRGQALVHLTLLVACLVLLHVTPGEQWKPREVGGDPTWRIVLLLAVHVGLPFFVLSATGPLLQAWVSRGGSSGKGGPYRLYALSNLGSLLALVSYPFVFEPLMGRRMQGEWWSWGMRAFVVACGACAVMAWWRYANQSSDPALRGDRGRGAPHGNVGPLPAPSETVVLEREERVGMARWALWFLLPMSASVLLLATTNKICQDIAVVPFLWVLPLALYLLTFVLAFDSPRWYWRRIYAVALAVGLWLVIREAFKPDDDALRAQVVLYAGVLFVACMVFHGELARLKPAVRHLTGFYLMIAAGGAAGGIFVGVVAPLIFSDYRELEIAMLMGGVLLAAAWFVDKTSPFYPRKAAASVRFHNKWMRFGWMGLAGLIVVGGVVLPMLPLFPPSWLQSVSRLSSSWSQSVSQFSSSWLQRVSLPTSWLQKMPPLFPSPSKSDAKLVAKYRSFYGVLSIYEYNVNDSAEHFRTLQHGRITHGLQYINGDHRNEPTSYYEEGTGVWLAVEELAGGGGKGPRHIGVVGLGTGTMAAYGREGDRVRFYEINPQVEFLARRHFSYLADCKGKVDVVLGDARLSLEREEPQKFDVLVLDAFSGDAIPVHLLTREAIEIYLRHMKEHGIIAVHISNKYLDLEPVTARLAEHFGLHAWTVNYTGGDYPSDWILLARDEGVFEHVNWNDVGGSKSQMKNGPLWTDDYASLLPILRK